MRDAVRLLTHGKHRATSQPDKGHCETIRSVPRERSKPVKRRSGTAASLVQQPKRAVQDLLDRIGRLAVVFPDRQPAVDAARSRVSVRLLENLP